MIYAGPWRNSRWQPYERTCRIDELKEFEPKLAALLQTYGSAFNDRYWFYLATNKVWVRAVPIWQKKKRVDMESYRRGRIRRLMSDRKQTHF